MKTAFQSGDMRIENLDPQPAARGKSQPSAADIRKAAEDFEGLLIAQMLQSIRESALSGWQAEKQDSASDVALEMAESQLAKSMAASGGMGIARMLSQSLTPNKAEDKP